jgi:hypothetical protein
MDYRLEKNADFWFEYQSLVLLRSGEALNHPVAPSKIAHALTQMDHSFDISKKLIELIN